MPNTARPYSISLAKFTVKFRSYRFKVTVILILAMLFSGILSNFLIYRIAVRAQFTQLQDKLKAIAQTATLMIDADELLKIPLNEQGLQTQQYKNVEEKLLRVRNINQSVKYIYTMARTEENGILQFIVDPDAMVDDGGPETYPGSKYDATSFQEMLDGFEKPSVDKKIGSDAWGMLLSGYAPIYDKNGKAVALLGVDMAADDVYKMQKKLSNRSIIMLALGIVLSIVIATPISKRVTDPIKKLVEGTNHIASGELEYKVDVKGSDEIGELAKSFNKMASDLSKYIEELQRITMEKQRIESELKIASEIQTSMLPRIFPPFPEIKEFSVFATMDPAREVGGDLYDFFMIGRNKLCFIIGDASGKGVPAALFMAISKMLLKNEALRDIPPNEVLCRVNNILCPENETSMFITVLCMMLDINTGELEFSNGGHNPPLVCNGNGGFDFIDLPKGCAVGVMEDSIFESKKTILKPNDVIFLYTDGVTEAMNPENNQFSNERLRDCLASLKDRSIEDIIHGVREEVSVFTRGNIQSDDITMLAVKYNSHTGLSS